MNFIDTLTREERSRLEMGRNMVKMMIKSGQIAEQLSDEEVDRRTEEWWKKKYGIDHSDSLSKGV